MQPCTLFRERDVEREREKEMHHAANFSQKGKRGIIWRLGGSVGKLSLIGLRSVETGLWCGPPRLLSGVPSHAERAQSC